MLDHIGLSVSDYEIAKVFYQKALSVIGYELILEVQGFAGFGCKGDQGPIATFWIHENAESPSSNIHVAFNAKTREQVDAFYKSAIAAGGKDNGVPGVREIYHPDYYGAFVLDHDGNNIEVVCHEVALKDRDAEISKSVTVPVSSVEAFDIFVNQFNQWWPKEYTWSQDQLMSVNIEPKKNGHCYEIGPNGFHCQFGTVLAIEPARSIKLAWQIDSNGKPEPKLAQSSEITINFNEKSKTETIVELTHSGIERHGKDSDRYFDEFNSEYGWSYVLKQYADFINQV